MIRTDGILTLLLNALAARSRLSDNVGHILARLDVTTLARSKGDKGDKLPQNGPGVYTDSFFFFTTVTPAAAVFFSKSEDSVKFDIITSLLLLLILMHY